MARQATGQVLVRGRARGRVYGLRFRAYGERHYVTLGTDAEGWDRTRAEVELDNVLADVRRGIWRPPHPEPAPQPDKDPTFHEFASEWWAAKRREVSANTQTDYEWQLTHHLLPFFAKHQLSQITVAEVDRYRKSKVAESARLTEALSEWRQRLNRETDKRRRREIERQRPPKGLSAASINKTLVRLGQILDLADEYGMGGDKWRNPLRVNPRNRKLTTVKPPVVYLDRAEQIEALLQAAGQLDEQARPDRRHVPRRAMTATLVFAGLRLGELLALRWRHVDLAAGRLYVADAKTEAGVRHVELLPALRETLTAYKVGCPRTGPDDLVFATSRGQRFSRDNYRDRVFARAVEVANESRVPVDLPPLPQGLTPHKLRHTCCSLLFVCGYELPRVMAMLGHADKDVTLRIYAHVMDTDGGERERLRALVGIESGRDYWAPAGTSADAAGIEALPDDTERREKP